MKSATGRTLVACAWAIAIGCAHDGNDRGGDGGAKDAAAADGAVSTGGVGGTGGTGTGGGGGSTGGTGGGASTCAQREAAYEAAIANARSCQTSEDCQILWGQCGIGLGGCYALVNQTLDQKTLSDMGTAFGQAGCTRGVCNCAPPPPVACVDKLCSDPCPGQFLPNCPRPCTANDQAGQACSAGDECGNEIGDTCTCNASKWACVVHPPLGQGCNLVCARRN